MLCTKCNTGNPEGSRFCNACATLLSIRCTKCSNENPPGAKFCNQCAAPLHAPVVPPAAHDAHSASDGERRQITVLFCDLVGSTPLSQQFDAEEWRDIIAQYQQAAVGAIARFDGYLARKLGDGLLIYFGWPTAHEDDPERAIRAGLAILEAMASLNATRETAGGVRLAVRIGMHTGLVVIADGDEVFGETPNIAARVQTAAEPDTVFVTAATQRLVAEMFVVENRGPQPLKGVREPLTLYRIVQPSPLRRRGHRSSSRPPTPFIGREDEFRLILSRWQLARDGKGQLVLVVGEPGIGKSRLLEEFRARIKDDTHIWIECAGDQFFQNTPFHAVTQILDQGLGWRGDESPEERLDLLEQALEVSGVKLAEAVPLIAEMLNLPIPQKYPPLMFAPDQKRKRQLADLAAWIVNAARLQPVIIAIEDLQWIDPSTLELMQMLVEQVATASLLLLCTARSEFRVPWPMRAHHAQIMLSRLNPSQTRELVERVVARSDLSRDLIETVVKRTDGVPLFAEELTQLILDRGGQSVAHEIPSTLHDSLTARLDRLGPAREVAQVAAVLGREFSYNLLETVSEVPEADLRAALTRLADAELIYTRGVPPEATYQFKHALIQDAAYGELLKSKRRELHRAVAKALKDQSSTRTEENLALLAHHLSEAGEVTAALDAWSKAGDYAQGRGSFKEAEEIYRASLDFVETLGPSGERDKLEMGIRENLAASLAITRGFSSAEYIAVTDRIRALAEQHGNIDQLITQAQINWSEAFATGRLESAKIFADRYLELVQEGRKPASLVAYAHLLLTSTCYWRGKLEDAETSLAKTGVAGVLHNASLPDYSVYDLDATDVVLHYGHAALNAWTLGKSELARARIESSIKQGRQSRVAYVLVVALTFDSAFRIVAREIDATESAATEALRLSEEQGFPQFAARARAALGWAQAMRGRASDGISLINQGINGMALMAASLGSSVYLTWLAEALVAAGNLIEALETIEKALIVNPEELAYRPESIRCRGELRLLNETDNADDWDFREAIELARKIGAKALELRATTSLARFLNKHGKRGEARAKLAGIYNQFTEGLDTADLKGAKVLLDELNA